LHPAPTSQGRIHNIELVSDSQEVLDRQDWLQPRLPSNGLVEPLQEASISIVRPCLTKSSSV
jgi:hypothetical protein